jgi:hypothetical protein
MFYGNTKSLLKNIVRGLKTEPPQNDAEWQAQTDLVQACLTEMVEMSEPTAYPSIGTRYVHRPVADKLNRAMPHVRSLFDGHARPDHGFGTRRDDPSAALSRNRATPGLPGGNRTTLVSFISTRKVNVGMVLCPAWNAKDWFRAYPQAQNVVVTITYPNGTVVEAIVLSHDDDEIRAMAAGCDDVLTFTRIHGTWISEDIEPVAIKFVWQRRRAAPTASEDDCVCPKALAARLIQSLFRGSEPEKGTSRTLYVLSPAGDRVAIYRTELLEPK